MIPIEGTPANVAALAGEWNGTYTSRDLDRQGTIWFRLVDGEDHARGDVRMIPRGSDQPYRYENPSPHMREPVQFLDIRFVRATATNIRGVLERYWDPDAGCFATTMFEGRINGDRIEGTFETRLMTGIVALGRWQASRKPAR